mgnify:CR=1 FL=1
MISVIYFGANAGIFQHDSTVITCCSNGSWQTGSDKHEMKYRYNIKNIYNSLIELYDWADKFWYWDHAMISSILFYIYCFTATKRYNQNQNNAQLNCISKRNTNKERHVSIRQGCQAALWDFASELRSHKSYSWRILPILINISNMLRSLPDSRLASNPSKRGLYC